MNHDNEFLKDLNKEQQRAVVHKEGPLLILAGAGSGKTSTMTHRIAHLIRNEGVSPYNILAVTFTNKAAKEMRDRVEALIGEASGLWILTFHSACLRILRLYSDRIGYDRNFVVYDPADQKTVIKNCMKEHGIEDKKLTPAYVLSIISDCKEKGLTPDEYETNNSDNFRVRSIATLYRSYQRTLKTNNAMDFDDLILRTVELFSRDREVLSLLQKRFQYIMVDEYQDTNTMQYRFIRALAEAHNNLCVVGDDDQCIYQWRGADINNILDFEKDFAGTKVIKLEQNYRSDGNILAAAHSVIEHNIGRKAKKLWTEKEKGEKLKYYRADDDKEEARYIAAEIRKLSGIDRMLSDFAVLYRTNTQSRRFEEAFTNAGIPYRVLGGHRYYDRKEVKDMVAYMRIVENPADDLSLERIINEPKRGVGDKTLSKIRALASVRGESLFAVLSDHEVLDGLSEKPKQALKQMTEVLQELAQGKDELAVSEIYDALLLRTGYFQGLEEQNNIEAETRMENLLEFKTVIYDYEKGKLDANETGSLSDFMESIALMAEVDNHDPEENAVVLMTLHSAKGLEFPVVFMPGMEDGLFPGWRAFEKPDGIEEERRLCYVGMTRAKEVLYLTSAELRTIYGKTEYTRESQFLREMDRSLMEGDAIRQGKFNPYSTEKENPEVTNAPAFRPFAGLRPTRDRIHTGPSLKDVELAEGDRIRHTKFGQGIIATLEGNVVTVDFDSGERKKLALDIAPLEKV